MRELFNAMPVAEALLSLSAEELGAKLLFLARRRMETEMPRQDIFHPDSMTEELDHGPVPSDQRYPDQHLNQVKAAVAEAWAWLEAQVLILPAPGINGRNGFR